MSIPSFSEGERVELCGLVKGSHMNNRVGVVVGSLLHGRYPVKLVQDKQIAVKPENLMKTSTESYGVGCCCGCRKLFSDSSLTVCGNCQMVFYCSKKCQQLAWHQRHKEECASYKQGQKAKGDETKLPTDPEERLITRYFRARRWRDTGKHAKAEVEYKVILQEPAFVEHVAIYVGLAASIMKQNEPQKHDEAIAFLHKAVALPNIMPEELPHHVNGHYLLGTLLAAQGKDLVEAESAYKKALELDDGHHYLLNAAAVKCSLQDVQQKLARASASKKKMARASNKNK